MISFVTGYSCKKSASMSRHTSSKNAIQCRGNVYNFQGRDFERLPFSLLLLLGVRKQSTQSMHSSMMRTARLLTYPEGWGSLHPGGWVVLHPGGSALRGPASEGGLPRGVFCPGGLHPEGVCQTPQPPSLPTGGGWTGVKTLPSRNFVCGR